MKALKLLVLICLVNCYSCKEDKITTDVKPTETVLIGEVIGRPESKMLWMTKYYEDFRTDSVIEIPIIDHKFHFKFKTEAVESYVLAFKEEAETGSWRMVTIFSEKDTLKIKLHDDAHYDDNVIEGGTVNKEYQDYKAIERIKFYSKYDSITEKYKEYDYKDFYSDAYRELMIRLEKTDTKAEEVAIYRERDVLEKQGLKWNNLGKTRDEEYKDIKDEHNEYKYSYIANNTSLLAYDMLVMDMILHKEDISIEKIRPSFNRFKKKYPKHPYTVLGQNLVLGLTNLKPGGKYINFTAPDTNGKFYELKSILEQNEIVLLDLWATWCGPCIVHTREARPVYEKYKDKGFTILGVAGEFKNLERYTKFMAKEQWPWQQLIELDKENKIWEKYSIMNSGGGMFLISSEGKILAVDPSAEELDAILEEKLASNTLKL